MAHSLVAALQRRKRSIETLHVMLQDVDEILHAFADLASDRELTQAEQDERAALEVRRERIANSITEAESSSSRSPGGRRG